jgi:uncharacterized protein (DUF2141 family)
MNYRDRILAALCVAARPPAWMAAPVQARDEGAAKLRVEVASFRNAKGTLNCRLFTDAASFPDGEGVRTVRARIDGAQAACVFEGRVPGACVEAVVHDENGNVRLDRNFVGIPSEGYGVSSNRTYAMASPKWDESCLTLAAREALVLRIGLSY